MKQELDHLFRALAKALADKLESGEASAADLGVVRQFLKDNNIGISPGDNSDIDRITQHLPFPSNDPKEVARDLHLN